MKRFARLYAELDASASTLRKVEALRRYFAETPAEDAAWGLYFMLGLRLKRVIAPAKLRGWLADLSGLAPAVIEQSYSHVGDFAETVALVLDTRAGASPGGSTGNADELPLHVCASELLALTGATESAQHDYVLARWTTLPFLECFLFTKLLTGSLRVGVSSGLAARALAEHAGLDLNLVQTRLMGEWTPSAEAFASLLAPGEQARHAGQPYPFCLASPLENEPATLGEPSDFLVEWKWDGIRAQLIRRDGQTWVWSRGEELLNGRFPEVEEAAANMPDGTILDGEILAWRDETVLPFAILQKRIGRKTVGRKTLADAPVIFLAYDLIEWEGADWRTRPLLERRAQLDSVVASLKLKEVRAIRDSVPVIAARWDDLAALRDTARERGVEGLMLKRLDSAYVAGRRRGAWWKWKIGAMTIDTVLVYAQGGHGRRSNLYTDYTLAVWDGDALVPIAKAYSGLTDAELNEMDRWIRAHTTEKFGPVRSVEPLQVFEIAFEGIQASPRHKSGIALRFPRIARWRKDKKAEEADRLDEVKRLLRRGPAAPTVSG